MGSVGIPLDPFGIKPITFRFWSIVFGLLMFLLNLVTNAAILVKSVTECQMQILNKEQNIEPA